MVGSGALYLSEIYRAVQLMENLILNIHILVNDASNQKLVKTGLMGLFKYSTMVNSGLFKGPVNPEILRYHLILAKNLF